ncbi:MAG TPA: TetR/AcrR family transcriptional regulator [Acidimicrobiales bacterium]|nr:TetR/AcrR family transcriptional regulator [Acidimicrobiales bacterium]
MEAAPTGPNEPMEPKVRTFTENARRQQIVAAAIDTIAEVGFARASLARIAERIGVSKGVISYHFAGKDDLIRQVVIEIFEAARAFIIPLVLAESTGPARLRAYIESNLAFMREHRSSMVAIVDIARNGGVMADGRRRVDGRDADVAVHLLEQELARLQAAGELRGDFDPRVMAVAIRGAIESVPYRLAGDPDLDVDQYAKEIATIFDLATRVAD